MGFTIKDTMIRYADQYKITMLAGENGWANSISWIHLIEDTTIIHHFWGKELAVTTGLGFPDSDRLLHLIQTLLKHHSSGLIINVGNYIHDIPLDVIRFCNENDFPLLIVPWEVYLADMIKDFSLQIFMQGTSDKEVSDALIRAIKEPHNKNSYVHPLLSAFDLDGTFQVVIIMSDGLDSMDSLERQRISYKIQVYLEDITHNASFFYYDSSFILIANDVSSKYIYGVAQGMLKRAKKRMPERELYVGIGSLMIDIGQLHISYARAKAAATMAKNTSQPLLSFDDCGIYKLLYSIQDQAQLHEYETEYLSVLYEHDRKHNTNYLDTLENYIRYDRSIQAVSDAMFTHRNTILYRMNNIKKIVNCDFKDPEDCLKYRLAFEIRNILSWKD